MRFLVAKNDNLFCFYCRNNLPYGEPYTGIFYKDKGNRRRRLIFHVECYCSWVRDNTYRKYTAWKAEQTEPKKRGRPKIHQDGESVHRLRSLIHYHKKVGNETKVQELEAKLKEEL